MVAGEPTWSPFTSSVNRLPRGAAETPIERVSDETAATPRAGENTCLRPGKCSESWGEESGKGHEMPGRGAGSGEERKAINMQSPECEAILEWNLSLELEEVKTRPHMNLCMSVHSRFAK